MAGGDSEAIAQTLKPSPGEQSLVQVLAPSGAVQAASPALDGAVAPVPAAPGRRSDAPGTADAALRTTMTPIRVVAIGVGTSSGTRTVLVAQSLRPVEREHRGDRRDPGRRVAADAAAWSARPRSCSSAGRCARWRRSAVGSPAITARDLHARVPVPPAHDEVAALARDDERHARPAADGGGQPAAVRRRRQPRTAQPAGHPAGRPGPARRWRRCPAPTTTWSG